MYDLEKSEVPSSPDGSPASGSSAPYEAALTKAFEKFTSVTSEIFIFLLAYVILLIGVAVFGSKIANTLRNLLYIIPVLGVMAYVWLQQKGTVKEAQEKGIDVKAWFVRDSAQITGVRGAKPGSDLPKDVAVEVGFASGRAKIDGLVFGDKEPESPQSSSLEVLAEIFNQLNRSNQIKLISNAQRLLEKEQKPNG